MPFLQTTEDASLCTDLRRWLRLIAMLLLPTHRTVVDTADVKAAIGVLSTYLEKVEDWIAGATETPGSWWPHWDKWLSKLSGKKVDARTPGDGKLNVIEDAPGTYAKMK